MANQRTTAAMPKFQRLRSKLRDLLGRTKRPIWKGDHKETDAKSKPALSYLSPRLQYDTGVFLHLFVWGVLKYVSSK